MTVGELKKILEDFDDPTMIVTDGYEGDFDNPIIYTSYCIPDSNKERDGDRFWMGRHADVGYEIKRGENIPESRQCIVIGRTRN
jgi:hypothetical protein